MQSKNALLDIGGIMGERKGNPAKFLIINGRIKLDKCRVRYLRDWLDEQLACMVDE